MNYFLKLRYAIWIIVALSVIILATAGSLLYFSITNNHSDKGPEPRHHQPMDQFFRKELELTPEQTQKATEYRKDFFKSSHSIFDSLEKKRIAMIEELSKPKPDTVVLFKLANEMGNLHTQLKRGTILSLLKLRSICTPQQVQKLIKLNKDIIRPEGPMGRKGQHRNQNGNETKDTDRGQQGHPQ